MRSLKIGDALPEFSLPDESGEKVKRGSLLTGHPLVLFFYPMDESPICTAEVCAIRDAYEEFVDAGAVVIGVSSDSVESHKAFAQHHRLPFRLLSDSQGTLRRDLGVPKTMGVLPGRVTYVVDGKGIIQHIYSSQLEAEKHVREALQHLASLSSASHDRRAEGPPDQ